MSTVLHHVAKRERIPLPDPARDSIINSSDGNLRKALLVFEAMRMQKPDLTGDLDVAKPDWETYCVKVADAILQEQSAQRLLEVRGKVYELLSHCIPPTVVLKVSRNWWYSEPLCSLQTIAERLVERSDEQLKQQIIHWAAHYVRQCPFYDSALTQQELRMRQGAKNIFHLEAFIAKVMT